LATLIYFASRFNRLRNELKSGFLPDARAKQTRQFVIPSEVEESLAVQSKQQ